MVLGVVVSACGEAPVPCANGACVTLPPRIEKIDTDGYDDPPGSGWMFIVDSLRIADRRDIGFDIDGQCIAAGQCIDNSFAPIGPLGNDQIRQGLLRGETLWLIELAGLDLPFTGDDAHLTVKIYDAVDADGRAENNFSPPAGETRCCEFSISPNSVIGTPPQAISRLRGRITDNRLETEPGFIRAVLALGVPPYPSVAWERARIGARIPANLKSISDGVIGGAIPISAISQTENPYCKTVSDPLCPALIPESTMIDLVLALQQPDIDLDGDGLERMERDVLGNGRVKTCHDGSGAIVPPLAADAPWTCALQPQMADGFSAALELSAVPATVLGIGSAR
jgi:hypothetical protein